MSFMSQPWLVSSTIERLATEMQTERSPFSLSQANLYFSYPQSSASSKSQTKEAIQKDLHFTYPPASHPSLIKQKNYPTSC